MSPNIEFEGIFGLTVEEAQRFLLPHGIRVVRATIIDGGPLVLTMDYRTDRLNVGIQDGKITSIQGRG